MRIGFHHNYHHHHRQQQVRQLLWLSVSAVLDVSAAWRYTECMGAEGLSLQSLASMRLTADGAEVGTMLIRLLMLTGEEQKEERGKDGGKDRK